MYRKIRITVASLVVVLVCMLSSAGTLSYFTDTDAATNEFTVGNASTVLAIYNNADGSDEHIFNMSGLPLANTVTDDVPFYLRATNNGNIPVYQRFRVVIPNALASAITLSLYDCAITPTNMCSNNNYTATYVPPVDGDTPTDAEYYIVSNEKLEVNESTSEWPTTGIHVEGIENVDSTLLTCENNDANNCVFGISVYSDVVQATGFENATEAFVSLEGTH